MNAAEKAEALASIRQDVGAFGLGLVLGAAACYFVRPKGKATNALMMAQRWLAWGLLGGVSSAVSFYGRNHDKGGILGALIGLVFFAGVAWVLGYVWGLIKFAGRPTEQALSLPTAPRTRSAWPPAGVVVVALIGVAVLAVTGVSLVKEKVGKQEPKEWWEEPGAVEGATQEAMSQVRWIEDTERKAEKGDAVSQLALGQAYLEGNYGKPQNANVGVRWIRKAAEQGLSNAQNLLGACYRDGNGVTQDDAEAFRWSLKAAEQGHAKAQAVVGLTYLVGDDAVDASLNTPVTSVQLETSSERDEKAVYWLQKAAEQGQVQAQQTLGELYLHGKGVKQDDEMAFKWSKLAANQGDAEAQSLVGFFFSNGRGVEKDERKAAEWNRWAAVQGHTRSAALLGYAYATGVGALRDSQKALAWFYVAAVDAHKLGDEFESLLLGRIEELEDQLGKEQTTEAQEMAKTIVQDEAKIAQQADAGS